MENRNIMLFFLLILIIGAILYLEKDTKMLNMPINKDAEMTPELRGINGYINTGNISIAGLKGKVVLIDFWTYSCVNCIRTLPHLVEWDRKYRDKGLVIIGVHTPEFDFEKDYENVKRAVGRYNIKYPVVQDNGYETWRAFNNRYWPHKYLINPKGKIVYDHIGEGAYEETEKKIQELLSETDEVDMELSRIEDKTPKLVGTPELYAGYDFALPRGQNLGEQGLKPEQIVEYKLPEKILSNVVYLEGKWKSNRDNLEARGKGSIVLEFSASSVNIVADSKKQMKMEVLIDGKNVIDYAGDDVMLESGRSIVLINEPRLYNVFNGKYGNYELRLNVEDSFKFNAFTFG